MDYSECWKKCAKEALRRIDFYREKKEDNEFDVFYHSHLDLMQELLEEFCQADEKYVALIVKKERYQYDSGNSTPLYVTICKEPHWDKGGIMTTGGTHDATKFKPSSKDLQEILRILNKDGEKYERILIDKRCLEELRNEYWEDEVVRGDWDETHSLD